MTTSVKVEVQSDRLEKLASCQPVPAIAELIWNGFDADATQIDVHIKRNSLDGIDSIMVSDNGHGIDLAEALIVFKKYGGSWKKTKQRSRTEGRILHGQDGQGRYKAFALGNRVQWDSIYKDGDGSYKTITVTASRSDLTNFTISDPKQTTQEHTGTTVNIENLVRDFRKFDEPEEVARELAIRFASSLREDPNIKINFDNIRVDSKQFESKYQEYKLSPIEFDDGEQHEVSLAIIEWDIDVPRKLYFCDENGFALESQSPGIQAPEFNFTAYIRSAGIRQLEDNAAFAWGEDHPDLEKIISAAKEGMRSHFMTRRAEMAKDIIDEWKADDVYPFSGEPKDPIEQVERQVFDVVAKNVRDYLPSFDSSDSKSKKFSLQLLRQSIETSPTDVQRIIHEVLELPEDKASDLAELLEHTTLTAIVEASKVVADRLNFLRGLRILLFETESKNQFKERSQLHKILEDQLWIFGEEYALSVSDQSLNTVLEKHLALLKQTDDADHRDEVTLPDGRRGIVDLMLSRLIPQPQEERAEHLVIELKRPSQKINPDVLRQTQDYALAVAKDEQFAGTDTIWRFWAVSNDLTETANDMVSQSDRPFGLFYSKHNPNIEVWSMPWSMIIRRAEARLTFFQKRLQYTASDETGLGYLKSMHDKYLPDCIKKSGNPNN